MTLVDISMVDTNLHIVITILGIITVLATIIMGVFFLANDEDTSELLLLLIFLNIALFTMYNSISKHEVRSYIVDDYELLNEALKDHDIYSQPEKGYYKLIKERKD